MTEVLDWTPTGTPEAGPADIEVIRAPEDLAEFSWGYRSVHNRWLKARGEARRPEKQVSSKLEESLVGLADLLLFVGSVLSPAGLSRTFGASSAVSGDSEGIRWVLTNRRRIYLIDKQLTEGLSLSEEVDLAQLEADPDQYIRAVAPVPLEFLKNVEEEVRRVVVLGSDVNEEAASGPT